jgi:hypothetical protein
MPEEKVYKERSRGRTLDRVDHLLGNGYPTARRVNGPPSSSDRGNRKGHADSANAAGGGAKPVLRFQQGAQKQALPNFVLMRCALSARRVSLRCESREMPHPDKPDKRATTPAGIDG